MSPAFDTFEYIRGLPEVAWDTIFSFLDGGSLIAFAAAVPSLEYIAFQARFVRALKFTPDTDERTIEDFHASNISNRVQKLDFNNCIALASAAVLGCATSCANLQELCCVNCAVDPARLFALLATELNQVRSLEWTLDKYCLDEPSLVPRFKPSDMQLDSMYLELVPGQDNLLLLEEILSHCTCLRNLHIHAVRDARFFVSTFLIADLFAGFFDLHPSMSTFKFTSEEDLVLKEIRWPWAPLIEPARYMMFGNISYPTKPVSSRSVVDFEDGSHNVQLVGVKQAVVAMETDAHETHRRLSDAISMPERWAGVSSLCVVLLEPSGLQLLGAVHAFASRQDINAAQRFFKFCTPSITELNLSSFHFDSDTDGASIVGSTLHQLRALALTPCGANHADSLKSLALGCRNLEQLDIRAERELEEELMCQCCMLPPHFSEVCFKELHKSTKLRQLSVDCTTMMTSLDFLRECRVTDLRLSLQSKMTCTASFQLSLGRLLRANPRLSSLKIEVCDIPLRINDFTTNLAAISTLRQLCVITHAETTQDHVASFFSFMHAELPLLEVLHAHYVKKRRLVRAVTWVRQRYPVPDRPDSERGILLHNRPCIGCYRRGFIGLTKPRNL